MAYMNSGIEMKTSQYDWKMIALIMLFLGVVAVLVTVKLLFPDMTKEKLFSMLNSSSSVAMSPVTEVSQPVSGETKPAAAVIPVTKSPVQNQTQATTADTSVNVSDTQAPQTVKHRPVQSPVTPEPVKTTAENLVAANDADTTPVAPHTTPSRSDTPKQISCSAEDRVAELCQ